MAINELIARGSNPIQFESPVNRLAKMLQIQGAQQNIARGEMEQDQYLQGVERKNKLVQLMGGLPADATDDQRISALKGGTFFDEADKLEKVALERRKIGSEASAKDIETARKKLDIAGSAFNQVRQSPTLENANAVLDYLGANGVYTPDLVAQYKAQVAANPADIGRLADIAFRSAIDAKDQLAKNTSENLGGNMAYNSTDPLTGRVTQTGLVPITQSADNAATQATSRANNAATIANAAQIARMADSRSRDANRIASEGQVSSGGPVLGAPVPAVLPWANQSNPKDANKVKAAEQQRGAKEIEKDLDAAKKERDAAASAKRFLELNSKTTTGGLVDRMGITRGLQSLGADYSEMESITAKLAPAMRVEGSGSTSDFDGKQFERATVGVDKPKATNKNIANGVIARAQQAEEYADFRQTYLEQNGTLQGADRFWKDYANKNPIFDPAKEGTFELNKSRNTWRDHFKGGKPAAPQGAGLSADEAAELADLRRRLGK